MQTDVPNLLQHILLSGLPRMSQFPQPSAYGKYIPEGVATLLAHPLISIIATNSEARRNNLTQQTSHIRFALKIIIINNKRKTSKMYDFC